MHRIVAGMVVLLLGFPAVCADDKPKELDKPASPVEQYQTLCKEAQEARAAWQKAVQSAKSDEEQGKIWREQSPKSAFTEKFVALAQKYPKENFALDALIWVMTENFGPADKTEARKRAAEILAHDYVDSDKLAAGIPSLVSGLDSADDFLLRAIRDKSKNPSTRADAALAVAQSAALHASIVERLQKDPAQAGAFSTLFGEDKLNELKKADVAKLQEESARLFKDLCENYLPAVKPDRIVALCQMLSHSGGKGGETLLRTLIDKDMRPEVQGPACLTLAQMLKGRADGIATTDPKAADKAREEAEKLFERAVEKFADVKTGFRGTVGSVAKRELFDIRHLSVGKPVPDTEGEDQDGQKFKLSDYKGKVVLLDFWGEF